MRSPSIPMDLYYDITDEDYVTVWSQAVPKCLPTNTVTPIGGEMKFTTIALIVLLTSTSVTLSVLAWMLLVSLSLGLLKKYLKSKSVILQALSLVLFLKLATKGRESCYCLSSFWKPYS